MSPHSWGRGPGRSASVLGSRRPFLAGAGSGKGPDVPRRGTETTVAGPAVGPRSAREGRGAGSVAVWVGLGFAALRERSRTRRRCVPSDLVPRSDQRRQVRRGGSGEFRKLGGTRVGMAGGAGWLGREAGGPQSSAGAVGREQVLSWARVLTWGVGTGIGGSVAQWFAPRPGSLAAPGECHPCVGLAMGTEGARQLEVRPAAGDGSAV